MNEMEFLMAILNAICGRAQRLTGDRMEVVVYPAEGPPLVIYGDNVRWIPGEGEALGGRSDHSAQSHSMPRAAS